MKKVTYTFSLICALLITLGMGVMMGEFKFDSESHDFGRIPQNKSVTHEFVFTNTGDSPIIISDVKPTCGCSVAEFTKTPVKPSEKGTIKVVFNAAAAGPFTKSFIVRSNTKTPVKNLTIKGIVE